MKVAGVVKIQVVERKDRPYPKVLVNLPRLVLEEGYGKGTPLTVFVNGKYIVLSRDGTMPRATDPKKERLLNLLVQLFIKAFNDPKIGPKLAQFEEVEEILNLLGGE